MKIIIKTSTFSCRIDGRRKLSVSDVQYIAKKELAVRGQGAARLYVGKFVDKCPFRNFEGVWAMIVGDQLWGKKGCPSICLKSAPGFEERMT